MSDVSRVNQYNINPNCNKQNTTNSTSPPHTHSSYNHAVHIIRLRIHLLQKKLSASELRARSSSLYLCPGYKSRTCNGRYDENDAQQIVDTETGLFLCRECVRAYANHPNPPSRKEYTLELVDNQRELKGAMDDMRRVRVQLSGKVDSGGSGGVDQKQGQHQVLLRQGIFDLLQKVRPMRGAEPITSNLPSENIAMGIGSKRLAGTGRTAGNLLKKLVKKGIVSADGIGAGGEGGAEEGARRFLARRNEEGNEDELTFLKNAMGQEIAFELERGGGARANLLATKGRIRNKLVDAAAMKVGVDLGLVSRVLMEEKERKALAKKRKREEKADGGKRKKKNQSTELEFLQDNIGISRTGIGGGTGLSKEEKEKQRLQYLGGDDSSSDEEAVERESYYVTDETDELRNLPENDRRAAFQAQYKLEVERQKKLLGLSKLLDDTAAQRGSAGDDDVEDVAWEDG